MSFMDFEFSILDGLQGIHNPVLDKIMIGLTGLGEYGILWIAIALVLLLWKKHRKAGVILAVALILDLVLANLMLKPLIGRDRPCWLNDTINMLVAIPKDYSFPSGHTMASFASAAALFSYRKSWGIAAGLVGIGISFSRLYLYVHWPTDVAGGALLGLLCGIIASIMVKRFMRKES